MRVSFVALLAAAALASACHSATACDFFRCALYAVNDDLYPPGDPGLDPGIVFAVHARQGFGLSQAGFYNDPDVALASVALPPPPQPEGWGPAPGGGPTVVYGAYGRGRYAHRRHHAY